MKIKAAGRGVAMILLVTLLPSCMNYHGTVPSLLPSNIPQDLRLTMEDRTQLILLQAVLQNDTIRGFQQDEHRRRTPRNIPVSEVQAVEVRQVDGGKTAAAVLVSLGTLIVVVLATVAAEMEYGPGNLRLTRIAH
jgi:hypothetical protein